MSEHVLAILVKALGTGKAASDLKGVDAAVAHLGGTVNKGHAALTHFGSRMSQLAGAAGFVGLTAGALSIAGALEQGISKVEGMGLAVEKLTGVTGLSVHSASQLVAVFGRFGIEGDKVVAMAAFAEKTLGKLAAGVGSVTGGVTKLAKFEKLYGISLHDNTGKAVDYATELGRVADYYNSNRSAAQKAAVAATLFGKGYVALIPVLKLGSKGIAEVAAEADKLGLTLTSAQDVKNVHEFISAQRDAKEAIGGLEVQLGLLVMPDLTKGLKGLSSFVVSHKDEIKAFFADGLKVAEGLASFVTGTLIPSVRGVGSAFLTGWNMIPAPLRDMIVKGAIADRTIKFLFGFSPIHTIIDLASSGLKSILGGLIGKGIVQPVLVTNPGAIGGLGAAGGAGGATSKLGKIGSAIGKVFLVGAAAGAFFELKGILDEQTGRNKVQGAGLTKQTNEFTKVAGIDQMRASLAGIDQSIMDMKHNDIAAGIAYNLNIDGVQDAVNAQRTTLQNAIASAESAISTASVRSTDRLEAIKATEASVRDKIESNKIATIAGLQSIRVATSAAGATAAAGGKQGGIISAAAIRAKDLSVTVKAIVNTAISVRSVIGAHTVYGQYVHVGPLQRQII